MHYFLFLFFVILFFILFYYMRLFGVHPDGSIIHNPCFIFYFGGSYLIFYLFAPLFLQLFDLFL
jgi:hypothetical protein